MAELKSLIVDKRNILDELDALNSNFGTVITPIYQNGWKSNGNYRCIEIGGNVLLVHMSFRNGTNAANTIIASGFPTGYYGSYVNPCFYEYGGYVEIVNGNLVIGSSVLPIANGVVNMIIFK